MKRHSAGRWIRFRAAGACAPRWRQPCSWSRTSCFLTNPATISILNPACGLKIISGFIRAQSFWSATTGGFSIQLLTQSFISRCAGWSPMAATMTSLKPRAANARRAGRPTSGTRPQSVCNCRDLLTGSVTRRAKPAKPSPSLKPWKEWRRSSRCRRMTRPFSDCRSRDSWRRLL